jgi:hypothetical protein
MRALAAALVVAACGPKPGYVATEPDQLVCGCQSGYECYDEVSKLAAREGETAESSERLLYLSQCACFQGSTAGCNTISHFARDHVAACERGENVAMACTVSGFVHYHGVTVPRLHGPSFERSLAIAKIAFGKACRAGSTVACRWRPR